MTTDQQPKEQDARDAAAAALQAQEKPDHTPADDFDGLEGKKASELTPEELRLMADTMPGEGPGD
jgi:hypothetical protein